MTYKEAKTKIDEARIKLIGIDTLNANVPHFIKGFMVSPVERDNTTEEIIFDECITNNKDNETVLENMNLLSKELAPFIIVLMGGQNTSLILDSYLDSTISEGEGIYRK